MTASAALLGVRASALAEALGHQVRDPDPPVRRLVAVRDVGLLVPRSSAGCIVDR